MLIQFVVTCHHFNQRNPSKELLLLTRLQVSYPIVPVLCRPAEGWRLISRSCFLTFSTGWWSRESPRDLFVVSPLTDLLLTVS